MPFGANDLLFIHGPCLSTTTSKINIGGLMEDTARDYRVVPIALSLLNSLTLDKALDIKTYYIR